MKIKIHWEIRTMTSEGEFYEDENGRECQGSPEWKRMVIVDEVEIKDYQHLKEIFGNEDGDYDHSSTILMVTDWNNEVLIDFNYKAVNVYRASKFFDWKKSEDGLERDRVANQIVTYLDAEEKYRRENYDRKEKQFFDYMKYRLKDEAEAKKRGDTK